MWIAIGLTIVIAALCFLAFWAYVKKNVIKGRVSGSGSVRGRDAIPIPEPPREYFQSIMPIALPITRPPHASSHGVKPAPLAPKQISASSHRAAAGRMISAAAVKRIERDKPTVFYTHRHLIPLAERMAGEVWPSPGDGVSALPGLPDAGLTFEQAAALASHHASLRLFAALDAAFSVSCFRREYRAFHELLYYHIMKNCGSRELARRVAMGVRKYTRNGAQIFGERNEKIVLERLNGVFWSGVRAEKAGGVGAAASRSFQFAFSMACGFTAHYDAALGMLEEHCGVRQARPVFAIILPEESELPLAPDGDLCEYAPESWFNLLDWVEDSAAFRRLCDETREGGALETCYLCGGNPELSPSVKLLNGWKLHRRCVDMLAARLSKLRTVQEAAKLFRGSPNLLCAFRLINAYWPEDPPDWENRRETVFARAEGHCENCGRAESELAVHRVKQLSASGNHACDNLLCLCPPCAGKLERHQKSGAPEEWPSLYLAKLETIREAMAHERRLVFTYNMNETRAILPTEWAKRRGFWMIKGYCYLSRGDKLFNPRKMTDLKIL